MEGRTVELAREIFKEKFIGLSELTPFFQQLGFSLEEINKVSIPSIPFSKEELEKYSNDYILILGVGIIRKQPLSIRFMRGEFGIEPDVSEPCFYNQDWYLNENFIDKVLENKWYLIKKNVLENSRAIQPVDLINKGVSFPSAVLSAYTFFAYYFYNKDILWQYDFLWCSDLDHNGDRVYVGKYQDIDAINKNGFSIHRHLALRNCYAAVNIV